MRKATPQDAPQIVEWFLRYFLENQKLMPMKVSCDFHMVRQWIEHALNHPDLISYISDNGVILGELGHTWMGPNKVARGGIWYVKPEARNGMLAMALLRAFNKEAGERGAIYAKQELDNPARIEVIDGLYKLAGYREYSKTYVKEFK
jgi:hypothetical protein